MKKDFKSWIESKSKEELIELLTSIDKEKEAEKYEMIEERLKELEKIGNNEILRNMGEAENAEIKQMKGDSTASPKEYASVWIRFAALVIDGLLLLPFYLFLVFLSSLNESHPEPSIGIAALFILLSMIGFAFWNSIIRMGKTGQSLGRKFLNIAVLDDRGKPIGVGKAFLREYIGRAISGMVCYIGYLNAFWDHDRQMWHDKLASSYVYYVEDDFS